MAEYRDHYGEILAAGADVAGVSVDDPESSAQLKKSLKLPFPLLCDTGRDLVKAWGVFNANERNGIAYPSLFIVEPGMRVRFSAVDRMGARVTPSAVAAMLRAGTVPAHGPERHRVIPRPMDWVRAVRNHSSGR